MAVAGPVVVGEPLEFDITAQVQRWLAEPGSRHGLLLYPDSSDVLAVSLASFDHSVASWRPQLEISYR